MDGADGLVRWSWSGVAVREVENARSNQSEGSCSLAASGLSRTSTSCGAEILVKNIERL